jgi:hypothetical protein
MTSRHSDFGGVAAVRDGTSLLYSVAGTEDGDQWAFVIFHHRSPSGRVACLNGK